MVSRGHNVEIVVLDEPTAPWLANIGFPVHALGAGLTSYRYSSKLLPWLKKHGGGFLDSMVGEDTKKSVTYDVALAYKLSKPGQSTPLLDSTEESREGASALQGVNAALEQLVRKTLNYIRQNQ